MILFTLRCAHGHEFEAWFRDGDGFEAQQKPARSPVRNAAIARSRRRSWRLASPAPARVPAISPAQFRAALIEMRRQVETNCDYVGSRFAEEARRIHYGEIDPHGIYGEATDEESRELDDEGIKFGRMPWIPTTDS